MFTIKDFKEATMLSGKVRIQIRFGEIIHNGSIEDIDENLDKAEIINMQAIEPKYFDIVINAPEKKTYIRTVTLEVYTKAYTDIEVDEMIRESIIPNTSTVDFTFINIAKNKEEENNNDEKCN